MNNCKTLLRKILSKKQFKINCKLDQLSFTVLREMDSIPLGSPRNKYKTDFGSNYL